MKNQTLQNAQLDALVTQDPVFNRKKEVNLLIARLEAMKGVHRGLFLRAIVSKLTIDSFEELSEMAEVFEGDTSKQGEVES